MLYHKLLTVAYIITRTSLYDSDELKQSSARNDTAYPSLIANQITSLIANQIKIALCGVWCHIFNFLYREGGRGRVQARTYIVRIAPKVMSNM